MKTIKNKKSCELSLWKNGWYQHLGNCIASEKCPYCGERIFVKDEVIDKTFNKIYYYECSACQWRNA